MTITPRTRRLFTLLAVFLGLALFAAACGDDDDATDPVSAGDDTSETAGGDAPSDDDDNGGDDDADDADGDWETVTVTDSAGTEVTLESRPTRIISLSPSSTEMLFAIGAGDQVLAVDAFSNFPDTAPTDSDLSGYEPNVEGIIGMDPDLVVIQSDSNDLVAGLETAGIPVITQAAAENLDDAYSQIELLGAATGHLADAASLVADMQTEIEALLAQVPERDEPITFYHEVSTTYFSLTSATFAGQLYELAGFENIADSAEDEYGTGYPQLTAEFIIDADPDVIFLADTIFENQTLETVSERDGWADMSAVQNGLVFELNDDVVSRWGPRLVDLFEIIVEAAVTVDAQVAAA